MHPDLNEGVFSTQHIMHLERRKCIKQVRENEFVKRGLNRSYSHQCSYRNIILILYIYNAKINYLFSSSRPISRLNEQQHTSITELTWVNKSLISTVGWVRSQSQLLWFIDPGWPTIGADLLESDIWSGIEPVWNANYAIFNLFKRFTIAKVHEDAHVGRIGLIH